MEKEQLTMGKKAGTLIGMPIYSLDHGRKLGSIKDVVYDSQNDRIIAFTLEQPGVFSPRRSILRFDKVKSIGRDAVMVESAGVFVRERNDPEISRILARGKGLTGKRVLTESGNNLGRISDILINESTGEAVSYEVTGGFGRDIGSGRNYVAAPRAVKVGREALIVPDEIETTFAEQEPGGLAGMYKAAAATGREWGEGISSYTQEQEINLSRGKTVGRDVYDDQGNLIVAKGDIVTDSVIDHAVSTGKMHQIALAAGVGGVVSGYEGIRGGVTGATAEQLRGRVVPEDITDDLGNLVIPRGTVITDDTIQLAQDRGVMAKLTRTVLRGTVQERAGTAYAGTRSWASETWSNLTTRSKEASDKASQRRVVAEQKQFLKGKVSATDVRDDTGNIILREGEVITPLVLDVLDRENKLHLVKLMPEGQPAEGPVEEAEEPTIHIVVERPDEHERHSM